jgi:hypothetical protein
MDSFRELLELRITKSCMKLKLLVFSAIASFSLIGCNSSIAKQTD